MTPRPTVILATSNGTGMGHLSRQLAVALALGDDVDVVIWSMSQAVPVVGSLGLRFEYCPGPHRGWMPTTVWHGYARDRLVALVDEVGADAVVFDGVAPYAGILAARRRLPTTPFVWSRRGLWRPGRNTRALRAAASFDVVVEPGDLGSAADSGATANRTDAERIPPVSLTDVVPRLDRREAALALGLDPDRPTALVTLGSGALGDTRTAGEAAISTLAADETWQIAATRSSIATGHGADTDNRVQPLRGVYPLVRYLAAFDIVISAAGYNAAHEFVPAGIPTLLVPNAATATDDQVARAEAMAERGLALVAAEDDPDAVAAATAALMDPAERQLLINAMAALDQPVGGAAAFAAIIRGLANDQLPDGSAFVAHHISSKERLADLRRDLSFGVQRLLGPQLTDKVRSVRGRMSDTPVTHRMHVRSDASRPGDAPVLRALDEVDASSLSGAAPVEHLLNGSSPAYRRRRRSIWSRAYDVD